MKTQVLANPLISSENMQSSVMGMDAKGADMATYYLRDKIYSDKILAVVREYCCNALDEHKKHGVNRAVDVGITKDGETNTFFVRDYAKGLSEDNIRNVFGMYFRSTKSGGNDQIGGFGIGSKAAHSYTDTFYVKSYHDGKCTLYACALGGGNSGVPVGHILKVSETPSEETGLEVSLEIKNLTDYRVFADRAFDFVRHCSQMIVLHIPDTAPIFPDTPIYSIERNGFKFRFYNMNSGTTPFGRPVSFTPCGKEVRIAMGDVFYFNADFYLYLNIAKGKGFLMNEHQIIVDVPIGRMTLPISRENFEETPNNNRVKEEIQKTIIEIMEEDVSNIATMSMQQLLDSKNEPMLAGKMFEIYKKHKYADIYPLVQNIAKCSDNIPLETVNGKVVCALLPNKASFEYWANKLRGHATSQGKNYYMVNEGYVDQCDRKKLEEFFIFKPIRSTFFNWPKNPKDKAACAMAQKFNVWGKWYSRYSWEKKFATALETHNHSRECLQLSAAGNQQTAEKQMSSLNIVSFEMLKIFTVYHGSDSNGADDRAIFTRSKTMKDNLLSLGWFELGSSQYKAVYDRLEKEQREKISRENVLNAVKLKFLDALSQTNLNNKFSKNLRRAEQAKNIIHAIEKEESIRGKVLKSIRNSGYHSLNSFSRKELRAILRLK
jgi:hypothetical protein